MNVKNFDHKRDYHALEDLPKLIKRILEFPKKEKVLPTYERLLRKIDQLQQQFQTNIHTIEQFVGV